MGFKKKLIMLALAAAILSGCGDNGNIATVNGNQVSKSEFAAYMKFKRIPDKDPAATDKQLDRYLERRGLAETIASQKLPDRELLDAELQEFRTEMFISRYFENYLRQTVNEEAIKNYYISNEDSYAEEKARVSHILLRTRSGMSETEQAAVQSKAVEVQSQVRTGKMKFEEAAAQYSEDNVSSKKGGDLGWIKKGGIDPAFTKAVFETLKQGDVSEPIPTAFGYHIIMVTEAPAKTKKPFEAVSGEIRHMLRAQAQEKEMKRLAENVKIKKN